MDGADDPGLALLGEVEGRPLLADHPLPGCPDEGALPGCRDEPQVAAALSPRQIAAQHIAPLAQQDVETRAAVGIEAQQDNIAQPGLRDQLGLVKQQRPPAIGAGDHQIGLRQHHRSAQERNMSAHIEVDGPADGLAKRPHPVDHSLGRGRHQAFALCRAVK